MARPRLQLIRSAIPQQAEDEGPRSTDQPRAERRHSRREALAALSDEELVALAAQELAEEAQSAARLPHGACEQLYRRYAGFAFNLAARIAGSSHDVEDVVHDAFLRAFDHLPSLRKPGAFRVWLGSIVVHAMRSRLRRRRFLRFFGVAGRSEGGAGDIDLDALVSDEAPPSARAEIAQVYALLATLSADDRIAWTLRFVEGHDLAETAELCRCSLATVKRRIRRAQSLLSQLSLPAVPQSAPESEDEP